MDAGQVDTPAGVHQMSIRMPQTGHRHSEKTVCSQGVRALLNTAVILCEMSHALMDITISLESAHANPSWQDRARLRDFVMQTGHSVILQPLSSYCPTGDEVRLMHQKGCV